MMIVSKVYLGLAYVMLGSLVKGQTDDTYSSPPLPANLKLVLNEQFSGGTLDRGLWDVDVDCWGGGNLEQQCYVDRPDVLLVNDGHLTFQPKVNPWGYKLTSQDTCTNSSPGACDGQLPVLSGRIHTKKDHGFKFGRFEMRAQLPKGKMLWPTFWLLPTTEKFGKWPSGGEIDIMETKGTSLDTVEQTLHHGSPWPNNMYFAHPHHQPGLSTGFHTFGVDYSQEGFKFYVDGKYIHEVRAKDRNWSNQNINSKQYEKDGHPFIDQEWYLIINLAVAGNYFGSGWKFDPENDPKTWSQPYSIDYVRVYQ